MTRILLSALLALAWLAPLRATPSAFQMTTTDWQGISYDEISIEQHVGSIDAVAPATSFSQTLRQTLAAAVTSPSPPAMSVLSGVNEMKRRLSTTATVPEWGARHVYQAGSLSRVDAPGISAVFITNCQTLEMTMLDVARKTYTRTPARSVGEALKSVGMSGARISIHYESERLRDRIIENERLQGYRIVSKIHYGGSAKAQDFTGTSLFYFSRIPQPKLSCGVDAAITAYAGPRSTTVTIPGADIQNTVTASGPAPPVDRVPTFFATELSSGSFTVSQRSNFRNVTPGDPVFSVPPGYTRLQ